MSRRKTVLVQHFSGLMPLGGIAWQSMAYVLGLKRLGYDVWYIEDNGANPYSPRQNSVVWDSTENIAFVRRMMERSGLGNRWAYWDPVTGQYVGLSKDELFALYAGADALINLCGVTKLRDEHLKCPVRIFLDTDPPYEQIRLFKGEADSLSYIGAHTHFFTYGENFGGADCPVPLTLPWKKTRPPVVLTEWQPDFDLPTTHYTSIATWQNKGKNIEFGGENYQWSKHLNFIRFLDLPRRASTRKFRLAMITPNRELNDELKGYGWDLVDPVPVSESMESYADFIRRSRGEFTVAKDIYVRTSIGWCSDRSVSYLAAGRPVITQATAAEKFIPHGRGLFCYRDWDGIFAALDAIEGDYRSHCRWAREIAEAYFDSDKLLRDMMEQAGV
ncbi:MAG: hypothetical protein FJX65_13395 [Alphaproteobacteria bacterium]|nr:hypothetical protein [Alphaproteobacteria bacterium]